MSLQMQIEHLHKQLTKAREADHIVFIGANGDPYAIAVPRIIGFYRCPELEHLEADILEAVKGR